MMRFFAAAVLGLVWAGAAVGQTVVQGAVASIAVSPSSTAAVPCQGGTGSVIATVSTTATLVCQSGNARSYANVTDSSGSSTGAIVMVGTFDGTTPTATHYNFNIFSGLGWDTSGYGSVPNGPIQLLSLAGTRTITSSAIQTGAAP